MPFRSADCLRCIGLSDSADKKPSAVCLCLHCYAVTCPARIHNCFTLIGSKLNYNKHSQFTTDTGTLAIYQNLTPRDNYLGPESHLKVELSPELKVGGLFLKELKIQLGGPSCSSNIWTFNVSLIISCVARTKPPQSWQEVFSEEIFEMWNIISWMIWIHAHHSDFYDFLSRISAESQHNHSMVSAESQ